jgi:DNA-binding SARP family transcriptional activator
VEENVLRFRMLGPLEAVADDELVDLGGIRQRATLGYLLLHANRVVGGSQLADALWAVGKAPPSARKIVQNSVWKLRRALSLNGAGDGVALLSQPPGYVLRTEPDRIDLHRFERLVEQGRAALAAGSPEAAVPPLQHALALHRGPVLADLVEAGIDWPELICVQNARLDAAEDYFEAELACGRHHEVLVEMKRLIATEPLRERLRCQLMLALYRCGRQADALEVYNAGRAALVEKLGLEPSHALQSLQQAILVHDPALIPARIRQQVELRMTGMSRDCTEPVQPGVALAPVDAGPAAAGVPDRRADGDGWVEEPAGRAAAAPPLLPAEVVERREVSVVIARIRLRPELGHVAPETVDDVVENAAATIREEVECLGGTVAASIGSIWLSLFGAPDSGENDAELAVHAALTIRDRLSISAGPADRAAPRDLDVHVAVATGEALVRYQPDRSDVPPTVSGALLDECHTLLSCTSAGEIQVCDTTRRATESAITYHPGRSPYGWQVGGFRQEYGALHAVPVIDREHDLEVLRGVMQRTRHRVTPHLVTVLGEPGIGKTRFIMEFERRVTGNPEAVRLLVGRIQPFEEDPLAVLGDVLRSYCGIARADRADTAAAKLARAVHRLVAGEQERLWLLPRLRPLLGPEDGAPRFAVEEVLAAWRHLAGEIAAAGPLVVIFEDLHCADDVVVDFVEDLAGSSGSVPLLVIATARPELLRRRPRWGGGVRHGLTMTLEPISDAAIDRLLEFLLSRTDGGTKDSAGAQLEAMLRCVGEEPDVRRGNLRRILASGSAPLRADRCAAGRRRPDRRAGPVHSAVRRKPGPGAAAVT